MAKTAKKNTRKGGKQEIILPAKSKKTKKKNEKVKVSLKERRITAAERAKRKYAEDLAKLPKTPVKRFFARLSPKRFFKWWFSWRGQKAILKFFCACFLMGIIFLGGLFLYYKKDLEEFKLNNLVISETVNTYLDRNGIVLWEDPGSEDYRLVVDGSEISTYMRQATVAIEDKNFYNHIGVDFSALARAVIATATGQGVQGGSTLTQQLIKQVYFAEEAASADRGGITRKIKELILAIELEKMYDKEDIITMYLNESPYGGRRNGVESAARTYFNKSAADLTLAESALLAAIPNNPAILNPYNEYGNEALIERQHKVLDCMAAQGYITEEEAEEAKTVDILATITPESSQYSDMLAPHFVLEVKAQLEEEYGIQTMRAGGFTITTTLDYRAQQLAESAVAAGSAYMKKNGSDNIALASVDVETSQVIAMVGSVDFYNSTYGETNATTSILEPGSSIKPLLDYAPLFMEREGMNFAPGSTLKDENIDRIYCAGNTGNCRLRNFTGGWYPSLTIRGALANSLNIAAVKALYINGIENSLDVLHRLGDVSYCKNSSGYGLAIAIGSGCGVKPIEHANAYASIARGGAYKDLTYILEVKNSSGDVLEKWVDEKATQVVDPQVAYMISDILSDSSARRNVFGSLATAGGFVVNGVWTATKTGTTTTSNSSVTKDSWMASYSTAISTVVWNGNHDGSGLTSSDSLVVRTVVNSYMESVHKQVYAQEGKWANGDKPIKPSGIHTETYYGKSEIYPSWFTEENTGITKEATEFNRYTGKLASSCTPESYRISIDVSKVTDPMTGTVVSTVEEPYTLEQADSCDYVPPAVSISVSGNTIKATFYKNTSDLAGYNLYVDGELKETGIAVVGAVTLDYELDGSEESIKVTVTDSSNYVASDEYHF